MFRANIYIRQLDAVLERLKDSELKEFDDKTKTFLIIEKGGEFLELYKSMTDAVHFISQPLKE
jgi:predicted transcriptional regulator